QLFDRYEATFGQDGMIARELDVRLAVRIRLRARKAESEDPPAAQRRRVPSSDPARFDATIGADGHDCAVVAITNETPDPSPAAVTELNHCVVPQALQYVRDVHVLTGHADPLEELAEELPGGADEGDPLFVLVEARRLADEHQIGVRRAGAEDDLRPRPRQSAALTAGDDVPVGDQREVSS